MSSLLRYAGSIIVRPIATWRAIANDRSSLAHVTLGYALPLVVLGPAATYVTRRIAGVRVGHVVYRTSVDTAAYQAVWSLIFAIVGLVLVALLVDAFAPLFGMRCSFGRAIRIAAFASTPAWLAALLVLVPALGFVQILGLAYEIFLLQAGLAIVTGISRRKAGALAAAALGGTILIAFAFGELSAKIAGGG